MLQSAIELSKLSFDNLTTEDLKLFSGLLKERYQQGPENSLRMAALLQNMENSIWNNVGHDYWVLRNDGQQIGVAGIKANSGNSEIAATLRPCEIVGPFIVESYQSKPLFEIILRETIHNAQELGYTEVMFTSSTQLDVNLFSEEYSLGDQIIYRQVF